MKLPAALVLFAGAAAAVNAQPRYLFLDRTSGAQAVYAVDDLDASNTITEPGELFTYFNNSTGIPPPRPLVWSGEPPTPGGGTFSHSSTPRGAPPRRWPRSRPWLSGRPTEQS